MAGEFVGFEIATYVVTAAIVLSGILIGVGRALGYRKLENFGVEEFFQSMVNGAIIGAFALVVELINEVAAGVGEGLCGEEKLVISQIVCNFTQISNLLTMLMNEIIKLLGTIGYYQTLAIDLDIITIQPFANLAALSNALGLEIILLQAAMIMINMNITIMNFIGQNALLVIFPLGLVFRTFFGTRRLGMFLIGLAIGFYIIYPSFIFIFPSPTEDIQNATANISDMNNKTYYSAVPLIELESSNALAAKLDVMSGRCFESNSTQCLEATENLSRSDVDFVGDLGFVFQQITAVTGRVLVYLVVAPLLSLIITIIFVKEITKIFGGEIAVDLIRIV